MIRFQLGQNLFFFCYAAWVCDANQDKGLGEFFVFLTQDSQYFGLE